MVLNKEINTNDFFYNILVKYGKSIRKPQIELSNDIEDSYSSGKIFIAEAEVGTGKTYAYLIPAINKISTSKKPFLISTGTILLQEQLLRKDIPDISRYLISEGIISSNLVSYIGKGKDHYICEKRLIDCTSNEQVLDKIKYLYENKSIFDRSNLDLHFDERLWKNINVKYCNRNRCKYRECLYRKMKNKQENFNYDFLVCNHQYLLACIKENKVNYINNFSGIIIDEAHNFEQAAFSILGNNKTLNDFIKCIERIDYKLSKDNYKFTGDEYRVKNSLVLARKLFSGIRNNTYIPERAVESIGQYDININSKIQDIAEELSDHLQNLNDKLSILSSFTSKNNYSEDGLYNEVKRLNSFLECIIYKKDDNIWWSQIVDNKLTLYCIPKNIDEILYSILFSKQLPIILTSGTMSSESVIKGSENLAFQYFTNNIGVDLIPFKKLKSPVSKKSGFNYAEHGLIYIEEEIKFVKRQDEDEYWLYMSKLSERIYRIIELSKGRSLILFTSKEAMDYTFDAISYKVKSNLGIKCLKQGQSQKIKHEFEEQINSCLFATGTYWEGIDVKGESLSTLIIHKLPFPVPSPIYNFKAERFNDEILIPEMIVKLKQGAGRLIRDEDDRGVLAILDSRAFDREYSKLIIENLPPLRRIKDLSLIEKFLDINKEAV